MASERDEGQQAAPEEHTSPRAPANITPPTESRGNPLDGPATQTAADAVVEAPAPPSVFAPEPPPPGVMLSRVGPVRLWLVNTPEPWSVGVDTMVVSASPDGFGYLGRSLFGRIPRSDAVDRALERVSPSNPQRLDIPEAPETASFAPGLRQVVLASTRPGGTSRDVRPATVAAAAQAARGAVGLAMRHGTRRLGISLLGAGAAGLEPEAVAAPLVAAVRSALTARPDALLREVCFIVNNEAAAVAIRKAAVEFRTQPVANDRPTGDDLLDVRDEVQALADMILLRQVQPPLAIGILGGWGSGKSFVMHLMRERIEAVRAQTLAEDETWEGANASPFVGHVYSIEFNAWTYARADLWAALMQRVLSELDRQVGIERRLLAKYGTLLDGAQWKQLSELPEMMHQLFEDTNTDGVNDLFAALEHAHAEDRARLVKVQQRLADLRETELLQKQTIEATVGSEVEARIDGSRWAPFRKLAAAAVDATEDEVSAWIRSFPSADAALADGKKSAENARALSSILQVLRPPDTKVAKTVLRKNRVAAAVFVLALVGTPLVIAALHDRLNAGSIPAAGAGIIAMIGAAARLARAWTDTVRRFADHVHRWRAEVDTEIARVEQTRTELVNAKVLESAELQATRSKIRAAEQEAGRLRERAELVGQFDSVGSIVAARLEAGTYRERLGVMQNIADDLRALSRSLTVAPRDAHSAEKRQVFPRGPARVVLFIDDLDRCPPAKVVEVLEAVQLLLATELFVVVVALDVRYVTKALEKVYEGVLAQNGDPSGLDYLEKIIQIPYRTRTMGPAAATQFVLGHTSAASLAEQPTSAAGVALHASANPSAEAAATAEPSPAAVAQELLFTEAEQVAIATCCALLELSPRAAKRVVNVCKLFRMVSARRGVAAPPLDQTALVALLVGLAAAHPEIQREVLRKLDSAGEVPESTVDNCLASFKIEPPESDAKRVLFARWHDSWSRFADSAPLQPPVPAAFRFGSERVEDCIDTIRFVSSFCFVAEAA